MCHLKTKNLANFVIFGMQQVSLFTEDFKKEDLADALVNMSVMDTVQCISNTATMNNIKNVFVCGSYAARDYMRELFTTEWERRNFQMKLMQQKASIHSLCVPK